MRKESIWSKAVRHSRLLGLGMPRLAMTGEFEGSGVTPPRSLAELAAYGIFVPDAIQSIRQPLYDRLIYPVAGQTQLRFFQLPQGQGTTSSIGGAAATKTLDDTNMEAAGQLPSPKAFLATSIEVIADPGSVSGGQVWSPIDIAFISNASAASVGIVPELDAANSLNLVLISGWLDFFVGSASYLQASRSDSFPAKSYVSSDTSIAVSGNLGFSGLQATRAVGRPFYLNPPILLMPNVNFVVTLNWPVAVAINQNARVTVRLDGILYRNAQ